MFARELPSSFTAARQTTLVRPGGLFVRDTDDTTPDHFTPRYTGGDITSRIDRSWNRIGVSLIDLRCRGPLTIDLHSKTPQLSTILEHVGGRLTVRTAGFAKQVAPTRDATLTLIPADLPVTAFGENIRYVRHLVLRLEPAALKTASECAGPASAAASASLRVFSDERLMRICRLLEQECDGGPPDCHFLGDALSIFLYRRLHSIAAICQVPPPASLYSGGLSPPSMRRVANLMEEDLSATVPVVRLAAVAGLSISHFNRAFKSSTGLPPRRWLTRIRCEKAKALLLEDQKGLAEIALEVGFCDQAHFSRCFARLVGSSPGAWRRARRQLLPSIV